LYLGEGVVTPGEIQLKLNKYKASLNFLQWKFLVRIFKNHILKLGVRGGSPGGMKLNKHKASLNFLQPKFLVENQYCPVKYILYAGLGKMGLIKLAFTA